MQKALLFKLLTIGGLMLVLLGVLAKIGGVVDERQFYRRTVINDMEKSGTGQQTITGAVLVFPYTETDTVYTREFKSGRWARIENRNQAKKFKYFLPDTLTIDGSMTTEERKRSIYKVPVYQANVALRGSFTIPDEHKFKDNLPDVSWGKPFIILGVSNTRGIQNITHFTINNKEMTPLPGTNTPHIQQGVHVPISLKFDKEQNIDFTITLALQGMEQLNFLPTGQNTNVTLASTWPHPSFSGNLLPQTREISDKGFKAGWKTSFFSTNMPELLANCVTSNNCFGFAQSAFGVTLNQGVDVYLQTERSIKYALLFVGLTFAVFFLFEILKNLRIHTVQYGLVGMALALFYLLLVSLSEHMAFITSYLIASAACIVLLGFYVSFVLQSLLRGTVFSSALAALYGVLYMLIRSEDYSLLMGSGLLFAVLGFIMVATRRVDWYRIEGGIKDQLPKPTYNREIVVFEQETQDS